MGSCNHGKYCNRRGAMAVLAAFCLVIVIAMTAFAFDIGYITVVKTDLQRAADAAAHAAVLEYRDSDDYVFTRIRKTASEYVKDNKVVKSTVSVEKGSQHGDIVVGRIDFQHPRNDMTQGDPDGYNAVRVTVRRTAERNGHVPLFFAKIWGRQGVDVEAQATAAVMHNVGGFRIPDTAESLPLLPITINEEFWEDSLNDLVDDWSYNSTDGSITNQGDGIDEVVLFPNNTGSAGNFGTINIGVTANSTSYLSKQIRNGLSKADLDYHGGSLELDHAGELFLTGDTGLSASVQNDLALIAGKPIIVPLYREVYGSGNTATYTIVKFVGVRIMAVNLSGGDKFVSVQPANVELQGTIQAKSGQNDTSEKIYSPPVFVR